jgi:hypothetical protein
VAQPIPVGAAPKPYRPTGWVRRSTVHAFLVTGNPGSGKSTVAAELARRGLVAVDSDDDPELSHWRDGAGRRTYLPVNLPAGGPGGANGELAPRTSVGLGPARPTTALTRPAAATRVGSRSGTGARYSRPRCFGSGPPRWTPCSRPGPSWTRSWRTSRVAKPSLEKHSNAWVGRATDPSVAVAPGPNRRLY